MRAPAFTDTVRCLLNEAGWSPDRIFDSTDTRAAHAARGLVLHPAAECFVRSYGGLTLPSARNGQETMLFPVEALARMSDDRLQATQAWLGESFAALGLTGTSNKLLLMSARGAVYAASEHVLVCYGSDIAELFMRLCGAKRMTERAWN